jgi:hypothetical protein
MSTCTAAGCSNPARRRGRCWACIKRDARARQDEQGGRGRWTPKRALVEAAVDLADADSEDDTAYRLAEAALCAAALRFAGVDIGVDNTAQNGPRIVLEKAGCDSEGGPVGPGAGGVSGRSL